MLKKMFKSCLAIAMVCAMSSSAMADAKVGGFVGVSFGQVSDGTNGYLENNTLGVITISASGEKFYGGAEIDLLSIPPGELTENCCGHVGWKASDAFTLTVGYADPGNNKQFAKGAGLMQGGWMGKYDVHFARVDYSGLHGKYKISDTMTANFGLLTADPIGGSYYRGGAGSGNYASVGGSMGAISFKAAMSNGVNDPNGSADASTAMLLGGKFAISDTMSASLDYETRKDGTNSDAENTAMAFQFTAKKIGPGNIIVTQATDTVKDGAATAYLDLVYDSVVSEPGAKMQVFYTMKTVGDGDAGTHMGVNFVKFF